MACVAGKEVQLSRYTVPNTKYTSHCPKTSEGQNQDCIPTFDTKAQALFTTWYYLQAEFFSRFTFLEICVYQDWDTVDILYN